MAAPQEREVYIDETGVGLQPAQQVYITEAFTLPEAAKALGRTELTLKHWIRDGLIPAPVLRDTQRGYRHYSAGELETIAEVLADHEREYGNYGARHEATRARIDQAVFAYRRQYV